MPALLGVSVAASLTMAVAVAWMLRPAGAARRSTGRAVVAAVLAVAVATTAGVLTGAETPEFLIGVSLATAPIALLLGAAAEEAAPGDHRVADLLVLVWAGVVFPSCLVIPPLLYRMCGSADCRVEDFGGALALLVSSGASALLAWRARHPPAEAGWVRFAVPVLVLWVGAAAWLMSLEGAIDAYTPRILVAAVLAPVGGALAWLTVDLLRRAERHPLRSVADGLVAGLVAIVPGAATVSFPWSLVVGALAGAAAALVYGAHRLASAGRAGHWALVVLTSTAIGYLAPAVSGDTVGFLFSGRIGALLPPLATFLAIAAFGLVVSAPIWALRRRRQTAEGAVRRQNSR